ncbi:hypothetical protein HHK36_026310 [Tetracentron sinense]|uniref:UBC core domain-containing protein n=1 Tax=Tetracentron sinense TaxID=13715 RepID=A0A834YIH2_TETSI|nr:hypothetical protein HHK36_026310 [Tetracentron sinense]
MSFTNLLDVDNTQFKSKYLSRSRRYYTDIIDMDETQFQSEDLSERCSNKPEGEIEETGEIQEIEDEVAMKFRLFRKFDIVKDPPSDHYYIQQQRLTRKRDIGSNVSTKIITEWKIMEENLPSSILVRAYEGRLDLMRAVIVGPDYTPYRHGLFFFDILFPSNYPARPPKVYYHSHGLRLNPNLYADDTVCSGFLDTWNGKVREQWIPEESTTLQLLVSIQAQVLNEEPYFNHHSLPWWRSREKKSLNYSKDAFILSCQTILCTLRAPPQNFEDFVVGHFRKQAHPILMNCKGYMESRTADMGKIFLELVEAFEVNGAYCKHHLYQVKKEEKPPKEITKDGFIMRILSKLMNMFIDLLVSSRMQNREIEETKDESEKLKEFKQFDVVTDDSDHYYYVKSNSSGKKDGVSNVAKKIMKEWKILEKNLPDSIYVRAYEGRIDLLRALIVGAAGTPYHDGLFFFDFRFPSDYPTQPPEVYYRGYGLRLNPNLYANGRVCLSLLNTWAGRKNERWNPSESTILQVLVSIQALVLNEKPYYNEPGHGIWPGRPYWEKQSSAYSEDVFLLSCRTMLYVLRKPPKHFGDFVVAHFRDRAQVILLACKAYMNGHVKVGGRRECGSFSSSSSSVSVVSNKFKGLMLNLYPELIAAFTRNGASVGHFIEQVNEKKIADRNHGETKKGITIAFQTRTKMAVDKLKEILGLKKVGNNSSGKIKKNS